jgi:hypothetical protein
MEIIKTINRRMRLRKALTSTSKVIGSRSRGGKETRLTRSDSTTILLIVVEELDKELEDKRDLKA